MINEEISNQMSRKLNEIKTSLSFQIQDAIRNAITEKILPSIQNTLEMQGRATYASVDRGSIGLQDSSKSANYTTGDRRSSGLQWNSEVENSQKTREMRPNTCFMHKNVRQMSRQSSEDSCTSKQNCDMYFHRKHRKFHLVVQLLQADTCRLSVRSLETLAMIMVILANS